MTDALKEKLGEAFRAVFPIALIVLGLSLTYIPVRRIGYSLLTVILSGQLIGLMQRIKGRPEAA